MSQAQSYPDYSDLTALKVDGTVVQVMVFSLRWLWFCNRGVGRCDEFGLEEFPA